MTRRSGRLPLALAVVFGAWEICFASFMADDLFQLAILEGVFPAASWAGVFDLYTLSDGDPAHVLAMKDAGLIPWLIPGRRSAHRGGARPLVDGLALSLRHPRIPPPPIGGTITLPLGPTAR